MRFKEDVIIFVNLLVIAHSVLNRILRVNSKVFFENLFRAVNKLGYSFSNKYLGSDSVFTKKFDFS